MKKLYKLSILAAFMLISGIMQSQILYYDFENLNVGDQVAATIGEPWTTWYNAPGSAADAFITDEYAEGARSLKIDIDNDVVLKLGDKTTGAYRVSLDMYIPDQKVGYFNILHDFAGSNSTWAVQVFLNRYYSGTYLLAGSEYYYFDNVPYNTWNHIEVDINLDNALACLKINGELQCIWDYTLFLQRDYNSISAMNFCDITGNTTDAGYYVDNILFEEIEGPYIVPQSESINAYIAHGDLNNISFGFSNESNIFGLLAYWIDYGVGGDGGEPNTMHYDTDPYYSYGNYYGSNSNPTPYIEIGALFDRSVLAPGGCMGTKVTKIQYFLPYASNGVGCEGPITFRIYNRQTDEVLAEKVLDEYSAGQWIEAVLDEPVPVTGFSVFATVGFQQIEEGYPISLDAGPSMQYRADLVRLDNGSWFSLNARAQSYGQQDWGNHNIRVVFEGEPVDASWVFSGSIDNDSIILFEGETIWRTFYFDARNADYGEYHATLVVVTNNDENPVFSIPINMYVSGADVEENAANKYELYPNPASDIIHIEGDDLNCAVIYDSAGKIVNVVQITNNSLNTSSLTQGVYYVNIINNKGESSIQKIVIEK